MENIRRINGIKLNFNTISDVQLSAIADYALLRITESENDYQSIVQEVTRRQAIADHIGPLVAERALNGELAEGHYDINGEDDSPYRNQPGAAQYAEIKPLQWPGEDRDD